MTQSLTTIYQSRVIAGELRADPAQGAALGVLQALLEQLEGYEPPSQGGLWGWFRKSASAPRGLYLYGDVGRGKTMLMELFFENVSVAKKRRVHFHQFMLEIHDRLHRYQQDGSVDGVLPRLARELAQETWLLCFDEFHVSNIADAMILGRLFGALFEAGVVVFVTTNWSADELYKGGLQRERFLPFIDLIKRRMNVYCLNGSVDHRYEHLRGLQNYFTPLGAASTEKLKKVFAELTGGTAPEKMALPVQGRIVEVRHAAKGAALFTFEELCSRPLGAADYLAIATCFHTILIDGVPQLMAEQRNETVRFTTLIDAFYESKVQLFMAASVLPEQLCSGGTESFTFQRTASRLAEMQTEEYRQQRHLG